MPSEESGGAVALLETKVCTGPCGKTKPLIDFPLRYDKGRSVGKRQSRCKACRNAYRVKRRQEVGWTPHKNRHEHQLRSDTRLNLSEYNAMLKAQDGVCALCRKTCATGRRLAVDHCHDTGRIRGLLCMRCNTAIGALGDTKESIEKVLAYVRG